MSTKNSIFISMIFLAGILLSACGQVAAAASQTKEPTLIPTVIVDTAIVAEGRLVPADTARLAFFASGQVAEVLVSEGEQVEAGQVVARLGDRQQIEASIASAETELLAAKQALSALEENLDIARAEASRAISGANRAVRDAQYLVDNYTVRSDQAGMSAMEAVSVTKDALDHAREAFEPYRLKSSNDSTRQDLKETLDEAQSSYNAAVRRLELESVLKEALAGLDQALLNYEDLTDGPDPDRVASLNAQLAAAQAAVTAGEASLSNLELVATISGTVVEMDLVVGATVTPGQPVVTVADFSEMYVETDDLTEIEVVEVKLGQGAKIVADALLDIEMHGAVVEISDLYEDKRGDVTYTARIKLEEVDPRLRWGMTVVVTFEE